ncbi:hypothetical protein [Egbenema bharatensis]|uniref:hypothetical protein n=1 Tax=Egbenema bharatensis TaxID=3463334 RepID=UPI003A8616E4
MRKFLSAIPGALLSLGLLTPIADARPLISSGEKPIETDLQGCLGRADELIKTLAIISSGQGPYHRSGYYEDGAFRILCYETGQERSLAIIFVAHETSQEVADTFLDLLLNEF